MPADSFSFQICDGDYEGVLVKDVKDRASLLGKLLICPVCHSDYCVAYDQTEIYCFDCPILTDSLDPSVPTGNFQFACLKRLYGREKVVFIKVCRNCVNEKEKQKVSRVVEEHILARQARKEKQVALKEQMRRKRLEKRRRRKEKKLRQKKILVHSVKEPTIVLRPRSIAIKNGKDKIKQPPRSACPSYRLRTRWAT